MASLPSSVAGLLEFAVFAEGELDYRYNIGRFEPPIEEEGAASVSFSIIVVGFSGDNKVLVAFPQRAWHRRAQHRLLAPQTLTKALCLQVGFCDDPDNRLQATLGGYSKIWLGWLNPALIHLVDFETEGEVDHPFLVFDSEEACFPFAEALQAAAVEKFGLGCADVGGDRLTALESQLGELKQGLQVLLAHVGPGSGGEGGSGFHSAAEEIAPAASVAAPLPPKRTVETPPGLGASPKAAASRKPAIRKNAQHYPGLDPGTVAEALRSGVPQEHLEMMSHLMQSKPGKLGDFPLNKPRVTFQGDDALDDDAVLEELVADDDEDGAVDSTSGLDPVGKALVQLTTIVKNLSSKQKKDSLEDLLDASSGQSVGSLDQPSISGKKHVKAMEALRKALRNEPHLIYKSVEGLMSEDFGLRSAVPNMAAPGMTARGWAEHRSRISGFPRTVRWVWGVCGILDSLRDSNPEQARARACLMLCQAEQESLDRGSHILSQEMSLEPPPPYASFNAHVIPDQLDVPFTRIMDPRWVEAMAAKVRDADGYLERRRKLGQKGYLSKDQNEDQPSAKAKAKGKGKGKGRGDGDAAALG